MKTLGEFILSKKNAGPIANEELMALIYAIKLSAMIINREINNQYGLLDEKIFNNTKNVHGENQLKIDLFANQTLQWAMKERTHGLVAGLASEEEENYHFLKENGKYVILFDPLDGSSNIGVNISVGTIFSIYRRLTPLGTPVNKYDFLQPGRNQIVAGYVVYGSSIILVFTIIGGWGVHAFTYDQSLGVFWLSKEKIRYPNTGYIYSINEGNSINFPLGVKKYINCCQEKAKVTQHPYISRYSGSLVADFHRNLIKGGIYLYPNTNIHPQGKLRLLYECNPMALLAEQAGGKASNGINPILDLKPNMLHQNSPLFIGNHNMVDEVEKFIYSATNI
ncbi:MAG: class 1 fructose-bisphosphatase [Candidatus Dasytiphilus stammeri]